ncbi:MAG: phenylalanyl--tRNA ligase subunit alpha, partial [Thermoproteota archaeon]
MDLAITLSEGEYRVLKEIVKQKRIDIDRLAAELGLPKPSVAAYVELLASKNLVKVIEEKYITIKITNEGRKWINKFPEEVLIEKLEELGGKANIKDLISLLGKENATIALSWAKKRGWIEIVHGNVYLKSKGKVESQRQLLLQALRGVFFKKGEEPHNTIEELKRRKMIEIEELTRKIIEVTDKGINAIKEAVVEVGVLTSDIIASGRWRAIKLKPYNVEAEPPRIYPGRKHFFIEFLEEVRRILHEMGFEEMRSYYVETEFWNFDVLFQAQDHPARE